ncbi:MAG TPA: SDR family NAD(P)-dependent oxidoreductase, partial [Candidatus Competibacteraceae bacterium]|nr:SDR family NAD(P)-dependent oxidoreductase [Candidatus Competibacteraceae bacterium]
MSNTQEQALTGQRALVTGASSGIGASIAKALAAAGAKVVVNYAGGADRAHAVARQIKAAGGEAMAIRADVSREDEVEAMFAGMIESWGSVDILVNNAGLQKDAPLVEMSLADWQRVLDINLTGQFLCSRAAVREFLRRG